MRPRLGPLTGLGLSAVGYLGLVGLARRALVRQRSAAQLEPALRAWLAQAGLVAQPHYLATPVGVVHVLEAGAGPRAIVVLPGLRSSGGEFAELLARLARHTRVVAIDLPGTGLSDPVTFSGHPGQAWNQVVGAVADALDLGTFDLVGHSLGGLAAGGFAVAHPDRVGRVVLISPLGLSRRIPLLWQVAVVPGLMDLRGLYERVIVARQGGAEASGSRPASWSTALVRYQTEVCQRLGVGSDLTLPGRLFRPFGPGPESRLLPALGLLADRVLVLWGDQDRRMSLPDALAELDYFPQIEVEVFRGAGHLLPVREPELVGRRILEFLDSPR